jgi:hypothetical protein
MKYRKKEIYQFFIKNKKSTLLIISILVLAIFIIISSISYPARTKDSKTVYFSIPTNIDLEHYVETSMLIKVDTKSYGSINFPEFASKHKKPDEVRLKEYLLTLKQKDIKKLKAMSINLPGIDLDTIFASSSKQFSDDAIGPNFEKIRMIDRFNFGNFIQFIWMKTSNSNLNENTHLGTVMFEQNDSGAIFCTTNVTTYPIPAILDNIVELQAESPGKYVPKELKTLKYEVPLIEGAKNHQAYFCCDGIPCDVNVFSDSTGSTNEIVRFYKQAYQTLKNQNLEEFAKFYTEKSRDKIIEWLRTDPNMAELFRNEAIRRERKIVFVINGDPVYIVFTYNPNIKNPINSVKYDYIIRENGTLKLSNFGYGDYFHQLLENRKYFIEPVIGPILKNKNNKTLLNQTG